jgi:hypothetical protein
MRIAIIAYDRLPELKTTTWLKIYTILSFLDYCFLTQRSKNRTDITKSIPELPVDLHQV